MAQFVHHDLELLNPSFDSPLVDVLTELEHLRRLQLGGTTPAPIFFQMKRIFHIFESLGSARIEGNHTTLVDYVEHKIDGEGTFSDHLREIENIERAMEYIESQIEAGGALSEHFVREIHALVVTGLEREGDQTPGTYRSGQVYIQNASHVPPDASTVSGYMSELMAFINRADPPKYDLMKIAIAHHRFGWIHPFSNGNGRVVRLLTYAMLIMYGFAVHGNQRILNPTAVFCNDRDVYYAMLASADTGTEEGRIEWCVYVLTGILAELKKLDHLSNYDYLKTRVLEPAIADARERRIITSLEASVLVRATRNCPIMAGDLADLMPDLNPGQRTYQIRKLIERKMLYPVAEGQRRYVPGFANTYLTRGVMKHLAKEGFIPDRLAG